MTITNPTTGKPMKHYAQDEVTRDRYIVIALQNETDPNTCSVVRYDALDSNLRSELLNAVNSDEFQSVPEIWKLLDKKFFYDYPQSSMLNILRALRQIKVVDQSHVKIELPDDKTMTPKEIISAINQYEQEKGQKTSKFRLTEPEKETISTEDSKRMNNMESRITTLEEQIGSLNHSITDLIDVIKQQAIKQSGE